MKIVLVGGGLALLLLAACDKPGTGNTCESTGGIVVDATDDSAFVLPSVQITRSQKVCWQNLGTRTHTITSDVVEDSVDHTLPPDFTYTKGFGMVQDFSYHCRFHTGMVGVIHVR